MEPLAFDQVESLFDVEFEIGTLPLKLAGFNRSELSRPRFPVLPNASRMTHLAVASICFASVSMRQVVSAKFMAFNNVQSTKSRSREVLRLLAVVPSVIAEVS
jgi:hypothetical protein